MNKYIFIFLGFIARFVIVCIPILIFNKIKNELVQPLDSWAESTIFWFLFSILILIAADYLKDYVKDRIKDKKYHPLERACRETGGTVRSLLENSDLSKNSIDSVMRDALRNIEAIVEVSLGKSRKEGHEITANCMRLITKKNTSPSLILTHWGSQLSGREPITLSVDGDLPGAPQAARSKEITYIDNTDGNDFKEFFCGKDYKSIMSIPLIKNNKVVGVLNIDSREKKAFFNERVFKNEVMPLIKAQTDVLSHCIRQSEVVDKVMNRRPVKNEVLIKL